MWVESTLRKYNAPDVKRMWVCGPPIMNELFDRTLMDMRTRTPAYMMIDPYHVELL